jgi:hypothetical protein
MIMKAEFYRGPHDGLFLTMKQIERYCQLVGAKRQTEERLFVMMPPPLDWLRVFEGKLSKEGPFDTLYAYELVTTVTGPALLLRDHEEFEAIIDG